MRLRNKCCGSKKEEKLMESGVWSLESGMKRDLIFVKLYPVTKSKILQFERVLYSSVNLCLVPDAY